MSEAAGERSSLGSAVAISAGAQLAARAANLALSLVAILAVSRSLGPAGFGDYVFILSFVTLLGLVSDFGITKIAIRDMARSPADEAVILGNSLIARVALALGCWLLAQALAWAMGLQLDLRLALGIAALLCLDDALLAVAAIFHVRIAAQYEALTSAFAQLIETAAVIALAIVGADLAQLLAVAVLARFAGATLAWSLARRRFGIRLAFDLSRVPGMLEEAAPVGITLGVAVAYLKLDGVLLGVMATPTDVGLYGAASKLIEYPMLGLSVALAPLFPLLARWFASDRRQFSAAHRGGVDGLVAVTLPLSIVAALVGPGLLSIIYPQEFSASAGALTVLAVSLVLIMHNAWQGFSLLAAGFQRVTLAYDLGGLAVNVVLNVVLISNYGFMGAAWAAFGTSLFIAVCSAVASKRLIGVTPGSHRLVAILAANVGFGAALWALLAAGVPWLAATILAAAAYPALLIVFRAARVAELQAVLPSRAPLMASPVGSSTIGSSGL